MEEKDIGGKSLQGISSQNMDLLRLSYFCMRKGEQMRGKPLVKKVASVLLCFMVVLAYATGFRDIFRASAEEATVRDGKAEQHATDDSTYVGSLVGENTLNEVQSGSDGRLPDGSVENPERVVIASWTWADNDGLLAYDKKTEKWYLDTAADEENPLTAELLEGCFPQSIKAVLEDGTEEELEITWDFSPLGDGVTKGTHTLQASLPEGYILAEDTEALAATIMLGGSIMMAAEETQEGQVTAGGLTITGKGISEGNGVTTGTDPTWGAYIQIETDTPVTISGTSTTHNIWIKENTTANITLAGVTITESAKKDSPINLLPGSTCNLTLKDGATNTLTISGSQSAAALHVAQTATLRVNGNGTLNATGGPNSAGIGGGHSEIAGTMIFNSGVVNARAWTSGTGGTCAGAGIGAGVVGGSTHIELNGGDINAWGAYHAAGIGAGYGNLDVVPYSEGNSQHGAVKGANRHKFYRKCGDITITNGFIKSTGGTHGGAFGAACVTTAQGCVIRVTGGTLIGKATSADMYAIDGNGGKIYITGGSVHPDGGKGFRMENGVNYAYDAEGGHVFMTTIDLSADLAGNLNAIIDRSGGEVTIGGKPYNYGPPYCMDNGKLYLWVPESAKGERLSIKFSYWDKDGKLQGLDPLFVEEADGNGSSLLKRYVEFEIPVDYIKDLNKFYDGLNFENFDFTKNGGIKASDDRILDENDDITVMTQRYDKENGTPIEKEVSSDKMPADAGIYKFTLISKQYAKPGSAFETSYWGHQATSWATIKRIPSKIDGAEYSIETEEKDGEKVVKSMTFKANIKQGDKYRKTTCKAPDGEMQFYVNGVKVGAPIKNQVSKATSGDIVKNTVLTEDGGYAYREVELVVDFSGTKYPAIPNLDSGKIDVEVKYTGGYNYEESSAVAKIQKDKPDNFPFVNPPIPMIPNGEVDPDDPDSEPDGKKLFPDEIERIEDGTDLLRLHGKVNDSISRKTEKDKTVALDELEALFEKRYVFVGLDGRLLEVDRSEISIVDRDGNPVTEIDLSNPGKYIVTQTVTDKQGNKTTVNLTYNVRKPSLIDPDLNKDTNDDGIPDINIDTDDDGLPDINIDTDGDDKPDINIDTDGDKKPDVNVDTDGDGKPDINKDTDGDGKPDVDIDTDGDGKPDVNVDTDGDGKPDINKDTDGDGKPDVDIDTDGDGKPDINIDTNGDGKPDIDIDTDGDGKPDINIDTNGDGKPDINIDTNGDGKPDIDIDTNGDGKPDINIDTNGDGKPDINIDTNGDGKPDINIDTDGDGIPDINIDTDGDGIPDLNVDIDGDGIPDINIDTDGDGKPDKNIKTPEEVEDILNENQESDELPWWIPRTGDAANMLAWLAVLVAAAIGLGGTAYAVKKKYR